jgi:peroxiredoxin
MKRKTFWLKMGLIVVLALAMTMPVGCVKDEPVAIDSKPETVVRPDDTNTAAKASEQESEPSEPQAESQTESQAKPQAKPQAASGTVVEAKVGIQIGDIAPDFELPRTDGGTVRLSDLRGKPVFINFMTTWCPPCQKELPAVQQIYEDYGKEVEVLVLSVGEPRSDIDAFFASGGYTFQILFDTDDVLYADYRIDFIPQSFFINANGVIVDYLSGGSTYQAFEASVKKLL